MPTQIDQFPVPPNEVNPGDVRVWNDDGTGQGQRQMGNIVGTLLASAARTTTVNGVAMVNPNHRGIILHVNITAFSGTSPTLQPRVNAINPVTGNAFPIWLPTALAAAAGEYTFALYPTALGSGANTWTASVNAMLPRTWSVDVVIGGTTPSITFSLGYGLLV
jgi:hypothetical protein